jgi:hypothetical protein
MNTSSCASHREILARMMTVVVSIALLGVFLRQWLGSGFDKLPGDEGDSLLNLYLVEHWYQWIFEGRGSWLSSVSFYPVPNTLGYSDALFLIALPYSAARLLGVGIFTAYQITLVFFCGLGYAAFYYLLRQGLGLGRIPSVIGAMLGILNNAFYLSVIHTQLFSLGLVPVALLLVVAFIRNAHGSARRRLLAGGALSLLWPALLYTGYYVGWFLLFLGVGFAFLLLLYDRLLNAGSWARAAWAWLSGHKLECAGYVALSVVALVPFVITYLPVLRETGGRSFTEVRLSLPAWYDFGNVGGENLIWGRAFAALFPDAAVRPLAHELTKGFPIVTLASFFVALWLVAAGHRRSRAAGATMAKGDLLPALTMVLGAVVLLTWLLQLQVGEQSAWRLVYKVVPGARAIRAVFRAEHLLAFAVAAVIAIAVDLVAAAREEQRERRTLLGHRVAQVGFLAVLALENLNGTNTFQLSKAALGADLERAAPSPAGCSVFFVTPPQTRRFDWYAVQTRAMLIGQRIGMPTINGYSGGSPPGWGMIDVYDQDYLSNAVAWLDLHKIECGVCTLDLDSGEWKPFDVRAAARPARLQAPLPPGAYRVRLELIQPPAELRRGEVRQVQVRLENLGGVTLSGLGAPDGRFSVRLSYQWINQHGRATGFNYRKQLPRALGPGESLTMDAELRAPVEPGPHELQVDLVQESIAWFKDKGSKVFVAMVRVW